MYSQIREIKESNGKQLPLNQTLINKMDEQMTSNQSLINKICGSNQVLINKIEAHTEQIGQSNSNQRDLIDLIMRKYFPGEAKSKGPESKKGNAKAEATGIEVRDLDANTAKAVIDNLSVTASAVSNNTEKGTSSTAKGIYIEQESIEINSSNDQEEQEQITTTTSVGEVDIKAKDIQVKEGIAEICQEGRNIHQL